MKKNTVKKIIKGVIVFFKKLVDRTENFKVVEPKEFRRLMDSDQKNNIKDYIFIY